METLHEFRYTLRTIRQTPGFSLVVTLTIALGIGAATAMFGLTDAVLFRPLPYPAQGSLVNLFDFQSGRDVNAMSYPEFADWRDRGGDVLESIAAFAARGEVLSGAGDAEQLLGVQASVEAAALLGLRPILGRGFVEADEVPNGPRVVVLGDRLWRSHFGADPGIVGRTVTLTGASYEVIGVFPSTAAAIPPSGYFAARGKPADFWEPLQRDGKTGDRGLHQLFVIGRLRPGVTLAQAKDRTERIADAIKRDRSTTHGMHLRPLAATLVGNLQTPLTILLTAVALLLLIACANVANLLLARSASRAREFAVRSALGADRGRLVSLVIVDSVIRAVSGGLLGVGLAFVIVRVARAALAGTIPRVGTAAINGRVLALACGLSLISGLAFGVTPALRASRRDLVAGLGGARGAAGHVSRDVVRRALMVTEIALSFVLLVGAALLAESYLGVMAVPKGFDPAGLMTARVWLPSTRYADGAAQNAFFDRLTDRLAGAFGSSAVALASDLPIEGGTYGGVGLSNPKFPDGAASVEKRIVSSNYFDVLKARLVRGRFFTPADSAGSQPVVLVNETFARLWLEGNPVGQSVAFSWGTKGTQTVVGVVADVREGALGDAPKPAIYIPRAQRPNSDMYVLVRTTRTPAEIVTTIRSSVASLDRALPVIDAKSADEIIAGSARPQQLTGTVIGAFAMSALALAAIGLYGLVSYAVAQRRQELGVRAAIGARPRDLMRLVLGQTMRITIAGVLYGAIGAAIVSRLLSSQLFGVTARDPRVYAAVGAVVFTVALLASAVPTLRATRADPLDALRVAE